MASMKALAEPMATLDGGEGYGGVVVGVRGLMVEVAGPLHAMSVGARVTVETASRAIPCEVVGFSGSNALLMPFAALDGVRHGGRAVGSAWGGAVACGGGRPPPPAVVVIGGGGSPPFPQVRPAAGGRCRPVPRRFRSA